jgi:hypothetical protein
MTVLAVAIGLPAYRYLAHLGTVPRSIAQNRYFTPWLVIHATGSATALLLGPWQFMGLVRRRWSGVHRWIGRAYVGGCLVGGASALVLAVGSSAGPVAGGGFFALGLVWLAVTGMGLAAALGRRFAVHRRWMLRSYALALAAVTLRLYMPASIALGADALVAYRAIAWLCWVPNLAVAEVWLAVDAGRKVPVGV